MTEPEILFPVKCPICLQESLTGFRFSVVAAGSPPEIFVCMPTAI